MTSERAEFTQELADDICTRIAQGKSLVKVCEELGLWYNTVMRWIDNHEDFGVKYAHAREARADYLADEILDISDTKELTSDDRRVRIDARKWYAGKLKPKVYGDRLGLDHSGEIALGERLRESSERLRGIRGEKPDNG